uniref:Uncharacterized protein n=1 Tax=Aegilops tauschii subsp. strangulata TaxID=200361 RepID=A0A453I6V7_AEGTS
KVLPNQMGTLSLLHLAFEPVVHCVPQQEPKNQLRRRNSASF